MAQAILNQILDQLQFLELAELQQLNQAVQDYLANQEEVAKRATFHQALVASGLVRQIKKSSYKKLIKQQLVHLAAVAVFRRWQNDLITALTQCSSGKELTVRGFAKDIELAAAFNTSNCVPFFTHNAYIKQSIQ